MERSMPLSSLPMSRLDASRCVVPVPMQPLALWTMLRFWRDDEDRQLLIMSQRKSRSQPERVGGPTKRPGPAMAQAAALKMLVSRYIHQRSYALRLLFAEAARNQARAFQISRPYDILAAYCGLVDRRIPEAALPVEVASIMGGYMVEARMVESGDPYSAAMSIAAETCEAIVENFGDGEFPPEPEDL